MIGYQEILWPCQCQYILHTATEDKFNATPCLLFFLRPVQVKMVTKHSEIPMHALHRTPLSHRPWRFPSIAMRQFGVSQQKSLLYAFHPISQKFPKCYHWNSSGVYQVNSFCLLVFLTWNPYMHSAHLSDISQCYHWNSSSLHQVNSFSLLVFLS